MSHPSIFDLSQQLDTQTFLNEYWQKKPCVIKGAWPDFECPIDENELAGLSLEQEVESRIISNIDGNWKVQQGPFEEDVFSNLPEHNWTLLIQGCDHLVDEIHQLRNYFDFLPSWLLDDVMISFATDQGSVGPHYDQFNVFLLQASGKRTWHLAKEDFKTKPEFIEPLPVKVLKTMPLYERFDVENGDLIYIPPGFAHHGVSQGNSISLSFGYRGPSISETFGQVGFTVDENSNEFSRLAFLKSEQQSSRIDQTHIEQTRQQIMHTLTDDMITQFLGHNFTELKEPIQCVNTEINELKEAFENSGVIYKALNARMAFTKQWLFANGEKFKLDEQTSIKLCEETEISLNELPIIHLDLIHELIELGVFDFE
ncbi:MAG: cupin domain-containing protein [Saccharospirillaceae bacterium]|nr:cupin domain-containing protein [Pseudomonadales bacterium]NRB80302.1 cupin domain-containing protein [Saccharospirillaceae bacterium]